MATARSVRPSPLKSPATRALGTIPAAYRTWSWKVPSPLPSNTDTSSEPPLATARSGRPSPLKSPATRAHGAVPAAYRTWSWKVPSPLPSNTDTSLEPSLATARSVRPSPLKSPATRARGASPAAYRHLVLEGAVAVAQQHRHVVGAAVGDGQVGAAVAVEVARHDGCRKEPHRDRLKG